MRMARVTTNSTTKRHTMKDDTHARPHGFGVTPHARLASIHQQRHATKQTHAQPPVAMGNGVRIGEASHPGPATGGLPEDVPMLDEAAEGHQDRHGLKIQVGEGATAGCLSAQYEQGHKDKMPKLQHHKRVGRLQILPPREQKQRQRSTGS